MLKEKLDCDHQDFRKLNTIAKLLEWALRFGIVAACFVIFGIIVCLDKGLEFSVESLRHTYRPGVVIYAAILQDFSFLLLAFIIYALECVNKTLKLSYQFSSKFSFLKWALIAVGIKVLQADFNSKSAGINDEFDIVEFVLIIALITLFVVIVLFGRNLSKKWSEVSKAHETLARLVRNYIYIETAILLVGSLICFILGIMLGGLISEKQIDLRVNIITEIFEIISVIVDICFFALLPKYYKAIINICAPYMSQTNEGLSNQDEMSSLADEHTNKDNIDELSKNALPPVNCSSCKWRNIGSAGVNCSLTNLQMDYNDSCDKYVHDEAIEAPSSRTQPSTLVFLFEGLLSCIAPIIGIFLYFYWRKSFDKARIFLYLAIIGILLRCGVSYLKHSHEHQRIYNEQRIDTEEKSSDSDEMLTDNNEASEDSDEDTSNQDEQPTFVTFFDGVIHDEEGYVNVREGRSSNSKIVSILHEGDVIRYIADDSDWWQVYDIYSGEFLGFVHRSRISYQDIDEY